MATAYTDMVMVLHCYILVGKLLLMRAYQPARVIRRCSDLRELTQTSEHRDIVLIFSTIIGPIHISLSVLVSGIVNKQQ